MTPLVFAVPRSARVCAAASVAVFLAGSAQAQDVRRWSASGTFEEVVATDCEECGDDIGMMIRCQGANRPAEVTVHWAAGDEGVEGASAPISVTVDGRQYTYSALTRYYGQIGYTPEFQLAPGDPLIPALQAGRSASIGFAGGQTEVSLAGSRQALDIFKAHCGWNQRAANAGSGVLSALSAMALDGNTEAAPAASQDQTFQLAQLGQAPAEPAGQVGVAIRNALNQPVDYYYIDPAGQPQFLYTLAPGEEVMQPSRPGLELAFGVDGQEIQAYVTTAVPGQSVTVGGGAPTAPSTADPVPPMAGGPDMADENGATWTSYNDGLNAVAVFGIPETDATSVVLTCAPNATGPSLEFMAGPEVGAAGAPVAVQLSGAAGAYPVDARATQFGRPAGYLAANAPAMRMIVGTDTIAVTVNGQPAGRFLGLSSSQAGRDFIADCPALAG